MADQFGYSYIDDLINQFAQLQQSTNKPFVPPVVQNSYTQPSRSGTLAGAPMIGNAGLGGSSLGQLQNFVGSSVNTLTPPAGPRPQNTFTSNPGVTPLQNPAVANAANTLNKWRLQADFNDKLQELMKAVPGVSVFSGGRSVEHQERLWKDAVKKYGSAEKARKNVAPPGGSEHNYGSAADLKFSTTAAREQAHKLASQYGLNFPMGHEPWHIEPVDARSKPNDKAQLVRENTDPTKISSKGSAVTGAYEGAPTSIPVPKQVTNSVTSIIDNLDPDVAWIIQRESGFKPTADNPKSTAFGLGQLIKQNRNSYAKKLGFHPDTIDPNQQLAMMLMYIKDRYGTAAKARRFKEANGWY